MKPNKLKFFPIPKEIQMDDISYKSLDTNQDSNRSGSGDIEIQIEDPKSLKLISKCIESISSPVLIQESTLNSHIPESLRRKEIEMNDLSYQSPNIDERSEKSQSKDTEMNIEEQKALTFDKKTINTLFSSTLPRKLTQQTSATESSSELSENSSSESSYEEDVEVSSSEEDAEALDDGEGNLFHHTQEAIDLLWSKATTFAKSDKIPDFTLHDGLKQDLFKLKTPRDFFDILITPNFVKNICKWSNNYIESKRKRKKLNSHQKKENKLDQMEVYTFLGVLLIMPLIQKPKLRDYWDTRRLTNTPGIRELISRDKFEWIKANIHFCDENNQFMKSQPFYKIQPLIDEILINTNSLYTPPQHLTLDESMVRFSGRSRFKVFMPMKPIKFGFKAYTITPSNQPIIISLRFHEKKESLVNLVSNIMMPFEGEGHVVFMDRYYTIPLVFKTLEDMGIGACGTSLANRLQLTPEMNTDIRSLARHETLFYTDKHLLLTVWKDKSTMMLLSTVHNIELKNASRNTKDPETFEHTVEVISIPQAINDYNHKAKGVDRADQYINYYQFRNRSVKWYFSIAVFLLEIATLNSWVLHKLSFLKRNIKYLSYLDFKRQLAKELLQAWKEHQQIPNTPPKDLERKRLQNIEEEAISLWGQCHLEKGTKKKWCSYCRSHQTNYLCGECNVSVCLIPCYDLHRVHRQ